MALRKEARIVYEPPRLQVVRRADDDRRIEFVSVVLPCLNEEAGVAATVKEALAGLASAEVQGEVVVVDNGSTDRSVEFAEAAGARVVHETRRGYGAALIAGVEAARGNVVVMADADQTYSLDKVGDLLAPLTTGADIVVGSRLQGGIATNAMPLLHRYVGTPVITRILRLLTGVNLSDSQSGYRAFWRDTVLALQLQATGMEYASEMLLKAGRAGLTLVDVPSPYKVRAGDSKLNTLGDGWRHIEMLLLLSPHLSLLLPGATAVIFALLLSSISIFAPSGLPIGTHRWLPVYLSPILLIVGAEMLLLGAIAAYRSPLTPPGLRKRLLFLGRARAVNHLLLRYTLVALVGLVLEAVLGVLWLSGSSSIQLLGFAGIAQALTVIGACGVATMFAAEYSKDHQGW